MNMRIVSLVPSLSETLVDLGLRDSLVGCTQFCTEPKDLHRTAMVVGGTKDFSLDKIRALNPTHIIANQEENPKELILEIADEYPLLLTFPKTPYDVSEMIRDMGRFLGLSFEATACEIEDKIRIYSPMKEPKRFLYFIWREPYMVVGSDTYISKFLEIFGFENVYKGEVRYPSLNVEDIRGLKPDVIFFSSEPYPFRKRDATRLREEWPGCPLIYKIDGRLMSWYGTILNEAWDMVQELANGQPLDSRLSLL
ncbi:MAG: cobalamin-binding protein [Proteobacteria bacterium]|nr:MAG: cobalamin-binding protein [Pseudomonadota bacterium]